MPFQMPQINDNIGNALANIGQIRQQRTQNALAERQFGLQEAEGRRQQQQFDAAQAAAQRAQLIDTTKNVLGALVRAVPDGPGAAQQRMELFRQMPGVPEEMRQQMLQRADAFEMRNLQLALNQFGTLTPDQIFGDARRKAEAEAEPEMVVTFAPDGKTPVRRAFNPYGPELAAGVVDAPDAEAVMTDRRTREEAARNRQLTREGWDRQDEREAARARSAASAAEAQRAAVEAQRAAAATAKGQAARTAATYYGQARDIFDTQLRDTASAGGPVQQVFGAARSAVDAERRRAVARFDAAVSFLRPAVKSVIRGPGEGTFTDSDQALLDSLLPDRSMNESEIQERLNNLEILLRDNGAVIPPARTPGTTPGASGGWGQATVVED